MSNQVPDLDPARAVSVGRISSPHGVRGDVKVHPLTDFPERFQAGARVWLRGVPVRIERGRWQGRVVVIKLEGYDTRDAVAALHDEELLVPEPATIREKDVFYLHDIIGLTVVDAADDELGQVTDVFSTGSNDVYVVDGARGQLLLPAIEDVVRDIDIQARRITVDLMEGLEFQPRPRAKTRRPPQQKASPDA